MRGSGIFLISLVTPRLCRGDSERFDRVRQSRDREASGYDYQGTRKASISYPVLPPGEDLGGGKGVLRTDTRL